MKTQSGFTLIELLVSMAILGVLMLAFTQVFGGSLRASSEINARNELLSEGQIAQQIITSRLQSAFYIYPENTTWQLTTSGTTTRNTVRSGAGQNWTVNTDPFIAMLVPPRTVGQCPSSSSASGDVAACFTFYAYYPIRRGTFISSNPNSAPDPDPNNADVWMLMEYRTNVFDGVNRASATTNCGALLGQGQTSCPPTSVAAYDSLIKSKPPGGRILVDYVQPTNIAPTYTMFTVQTANPATCPSNPNTCQSWVELDLRLLQNRVGKPLTAPSSSAPLSTRVYPRN